jgi:hypothetical protein
MSQKKYWLNILVFTDMWEQVAATNQHFLYKNKNIASMVRFWGRRPKAI